MATVCDECEADGPLSLCHDCADKLRDAVEVAETERDEAEDKRDGAVEGWRDAFEEAVKAAFGKKPEELTVADTAAPWGRWVSGLLDVYRGKP